VQRPFVGQFINRRKRYLPELRETLVRNLELRQAADYRPRSVSQAQAERALQRTRRFVEATGEEVNQREQRRDEPGGPAHPARGERARGVDP